MFSFIKKWFKKKPQPQPQEQDLFGDNFRKLAKAVIERPKDKPYDDYIKSRVLAPDISTFAQTLDFDNNLDITTYNLTELSKESKLKIIEIIKKDYEEKREKHWEATQQTIQQTQKQWKDLYNSDNIPPSK